MKRKDFLVMSGKIFLCGILAGVGYSCKSPLSPDEEKKKFESVSNTLNIAHTHSVTIQKSEIENPPSDGISKWTTNCNFDISRGSFGHAHLFSMTQEQLLRVKNGEGVQITASEFGGAGPYHTHDFYIEKWYD